MNKAKQMCRLLKLYQSVRISGSYVSYYFKSHNILTARLYTTEQPPGRVVDAVSHKQNHSASLCGALPTDSNASVDVRGVIDVNLITDGDKDLEKKYKIALLEIDIMRQEGERVPSWLSTAEWKDLLALGSRSARRKYLTFLFKKEKIRENERKKKEEKRAKRAEYFESRKADTSASEDKQFTYGLGKNSIFLRIDKAKINNFYNWKLMQAMMFSQEIVVDCGYDDHMTPYEASNCSKQLGLLFAYHREHVNPFNLFFCNARRDGRMLKTFEKLVPTCYEPHFPLNVTEKSYLDIFPKKRLVYLTPHCREELVEFDHNAVYIIGAFVDKTTPKPFSLAKAKEEGLKMAKLPLDKYLHWGGGSGKSLTLDAMIRIMLDVRHTGDWAKALQHVPQRKLVEFSARRAEKLQRDRIKYKLFE